MARTADPAIRTALIEAAAERMATDGLEALSLRRIAADVGTTTRAVYTHFGSKDELVRAVVVEAFARLEAEVSAVPVTDDPLADMAGTSQAYRRNALANANLYRVMFGLNPLGLRDPGGLGPIGPDDERLDIGLAAFGVMVDQAARCVDAGVLHGDPTELALKLWSTSHGAICLELAGFLGDHGETIYRDATAATFAGLARAGAASPPEL